MPNFRLSLKACREYFSIKQGVFEKALKPSAVKHIYDSPVKPIALYGVRYGRNTNHGIIINQLMNCLKCPLK